MRDKVTRILGDGIEVSDDLRNTGFKNLNTLIIGTTGSGKTRSFVIPNILAAEGSIVVTDTKGDLCGKLRGELEAKGYRVLCLDFTDCENMPVGYNPLGFVRVRDDQPDEQALMSIAAALCPLESHEPFWDYSARASRSSKRSIKRQPARSATIATRCCFSGPMIRRRLSGLASA